VKSIRPVSDSTGLIVGVDSYCWAYGILFQNWFSNWLIAVYLSLEGIDA